MPDERLLLDTLVNAVETMRAYQKLVTPGAPMAIRHAAQKWEREVDELLTLHLLAPLNPPEGGES